MSTQVLSLQKARESVQVCPSVDTRLQRTELRKRQLAATQTELTSVLPVEGTAVSVMIRRRIELLERVIEDPTFEERYPCLDIEVLGWRDGQGFPKLVPFSLTDPLFSLEADYKNSRRPEWKLRGSVAGLPRPMVSMYNDIFERFREELLESREYNWVKLWSKSITSRFSGVIPQWVRDNIKEASADFSVSPPRGEIAKGGWLRIKREVTKTVVATNIFLIAEVDKWVVNKEVVLRPDPLVVGYKAGCLWFICSFDETPLEKYVRMEFTV